jgi:outer membrane receptor protein involved in Fe transport
MQVQNVVSWIASVGALTIWYSAAAVGQQLALAARTPRFFYASSTAAKRVEIDVGRNAVLGRAISLHVEHASIGGVLAEIQRQTGITFAYDPQIPLSRPVTLEAESITFGAALGAILLGTGVDVVLTPTGHVWLTDSETRTAPTQEGTILGRVTDKQTREPIIGTTVVLEPVRKSTTTGTDGQYRFTHLAPGNYTVRARYIGYKSLVTSVAVSADQEVTVDFALERSAQQLEQIVTTGTVVSTEVKALPTPVSVISEHEIAIRRPESVQQLFRQVIPTAVSWDYPAYPFQTSFSVRGASSMSSGSGQMKVFVDGVEAALPTASAVDPNSIERIEVVRGPQAAAIYGSDAIGGVIQIFTKRGDPGLTRPRADASVAIGMIQTPYGGYGSVLRQNYSGALHGGDSGVSYNFGVGYSHTDDYLPGGETSAQSNPSVYGGMRYTGGIISADLSGRYYTQNNPAVFNPVLFQSGFSFYSKPLYQPARLHNQTLATRFSVAPTSWWQNTVTAGVDRFTQDIEQSQPRLTAPTDTLLTILSQSRTKTSIAYTSSMQGSLSSSVSGALTVGLDHYSLPFAQFLTTRAVNAVGTIRTSPTASLSASRSLTNNTGYFGQIQVGFRDALFVTGGIRAEENTEFGDSLGTPLSPRVGLSYVEQIATTTLKLRGAYGRAIRAPSPTQKFAVETATDVTVANPQLGPERQGGWDAGVDVEFASRASLGVTYYDQTADNLIQRVLLQSGPPVTFQWQNVGQVKNRGVEVEGTIHFGAVQLRGQYGYTRSRVENLPTNYTGDLRLGDQSFLTPRHTAGASLVIVPQTGATISAGVTYVGSWQFYDYVAYFRCLGQTGPCRNDTFALDRSYVIPYPDLLKFNVSVSRQVTPQVEGFLSIENLTNNHAYEFYNFNPVTGRVSTVGMRLQY